MFQVTLTAHLQSAATRQWVSQLLPIDHQEPLLLEKLKAAMRTSTGPHAKLISLTPGSRRNCSRRSTACGCCT